MKSANDFSFVFESSVHQKWTIIFARCACTFASCEWIVFWNVNFYVANVDGWKFETMQRKNYMVWWNVCDVSAGKEKKVWIAEILHALVI